MELSFTRVLRTCAVCALCKRFRIASLRRPPCFVNAGPAAISCAYSFPSSLFHLHPTHASGAGPSLDCICVRAQADSTRMMQFPYHSSTGSHLRVDAGTIRTAMAIWLCDPLLDSSQLSLVCPPLWACKAGFEVFSKTDSSYPILLNWLIYCSMFLWPLVFIIQVGLGLNIPSVTWWQLP